MKIPCFIIVLLSITYCHAQNFISKGIITYERKVQAHKILETNTWFKGNTDNIPKFYVSRFQLQFNQDTTYYKKTGEDEPGSAYWAIYSRDNEIVTMISSNQCISKKNIWNDTYLIKDSIRTYKSSSSSF